MEYTFKCIKSRKDALKAVPTFNPESSQMRPTVAVFDDILDLRSLFTEGILCCRIMMVSDTSIVIVI